MDTKRIRTPRGVWTLLLVLTALVLGSLMQEPALSSSPLQSGLPTPPFVRTTAGGRIFCGPQQGPAWLDLPSGFTSDPGAEVYCDPAASLAQTIGTTGAWDDRGYLLGVYPQAPLVRPLSLVLEVDPARTGEICPTCLVGRAYDPAAQRWRDLPTTYDRNNARVSIQVNTYPPASGFPGFVDRGLLALFTQQAPQPTTPPTQVPTATSVPATATPLPTPSPVPATATPELLPTAVPAAATIAPTAAAPEEVTQAAESPTTVVVAETPSPPDTNNGGGGSGLITAALAALVVVLVIAVVVLVRRLRK